MNKTLKAIAALVVLAVLALPMAAFGSITTLTQGIAKVGGLIIGGTQITATGNELNLLDGRDTAATRGTIPQYMVGAIVSTDTSTRSLFTLPAGAVPLSLVIAGAAASNATTSASISISVASASNYFVNSFDVKSTTYGAGQQLATASHIGVSVGAAAVPVYGRFTPDGGSTTGLTGGPWYVILGYKL